MIFDSFVIKYLVKYVKWFRDLIWKLLSTLSNKTVIVSSFFAIFMPKLTNSDATEHSISIEHLGWKKNYATSKMATMVKMAEPQEQLPPELKQEVSRSRLFSSEKSSYWPLQSVTSVTHHHNYETKTDASHCRVFLQPQDAIEIPHVPHHIYGSFVG